MKFERLLLVCLLLLLPWFFIGGPEYFAPRSHRALWNTGHLVFFAIAIRWLFAMPAIDAIYRQRRWFATLSALLLVLAVGVGIEYLQYGLERNPDCRDVLRNLLGALLGLLWVEWQNKLRRYHRSSLIVLALIVIAWPAFQVLVAAVDEFRMVRSFPVLADFSSSLEMSRWEGGAGRSRVPAPNGGGKWGMRVELDTAQYSGVRLVYLHTDWRLFNGLELQVFNTEPEVLPLVIRVHDRPHRAGEQLHSDRFNRRLQLQPGWNHLTIPLAEIQFAPKGREMDMSTIENVSLFTVKSPRAKVIFIDRLALTK